MNLWVYIFHVSLWDRGQVFQFESKAKQSKAKFDMLCCTSTRPRCFKFSQIYLPRCLCEDSPCRACSKSCDASAYTEWSSGLSGTRVRISAECACFYRNQGLDAFLVATLYFFLWKHPPKLSEPQQCLKLCARVLKRTHSSPFFQKYAVRVKHWR